MGESDWHSLLRRIALTPVSTRLARACGVFALLLVAMRPPSAKDLNPAEAFEELKKLCGEWKGTTANGGAEKVSYRLAAADTLLLEPGF